MTKDFNKRGNLKTEGNQKISDNFQDVGTLFFRIKSGCTPIVTRKFSDLYSISACSIV